MTLGAATVQLSHFQTQADVAVGVQAPYKLNAIGAGYDPGGWFVMGEWTRSAWQLTGDVLDWYVRGGYRAGAFTPYLGVEERRMLNQPRFTISPPQKSITAGVRWDVMKNVDIKLQYDRYSLGRNSTGTLINMQPGFVPGGAFHVVGANVDFVF